MRSVHAVAAARGPSALLVGVLVSMFVALLGAGHVAAHTGFESSTPGDGEVIDTPVDVVTIVFTGEANPVGDGFVALTPDGIVQPPASVETLDNKVFTVRFDPPLAGGQVGLRWNVQAADAHPIEGAFAFTVSAPPPPVATDSEVPEVAAPEVADSGPETIDPEAIDPEIAEPEITEPAVASEAIDEPGPTVPVVDDAAATPPSDATPRQSLDDFLAVDNTVPGETTASVGRLISLPSVAVGLGAFAFLAVAFRGRREEVRRVLLAVRVLGGAVAVGAAIEYVGVGRIGAQSLASTWSTAPGFATVLRFVGGVGLAAGLAGAVSASRPVRALSAAVIDDVANVAVPTHDSEVVRWTPNNRSRLAVAAVLVILVSFWFDGHTVSKGFRPLHALVNTVHVAAGAVWVGGVVVLSALVWSRIRSGEPSRLAELVVRFSKLATISLAAVVAAGGVMAFLVLDSFGELTGTEWGQILLLKSAAVGIAAVGGAYNHFRLLPMLEADPESRSTLAVLRSTVTSEAIVLVFVVMVTASLVVAAS